MACESLVTKGRQLVLLVRNEQDTAWTIIGGVRSRSYTIDSPVEDVTSSSTTTSFAESDFTGFSQVTLNVSGVADKRTGTDPNTGYEIVGASRLTQIATSGERCAKFQMINLETQGYIEGFFNVTSFGSTGETPGLLNFDATLQSKADIIVQGDV